jgi:TolB-like protein/class 3 adenylate cyclase/Flp pilus assembly protein TadD
MPQTRNLAAIMFTDIVGYTSLMGKDEKKAFNLLQKNRELQKPIVEQFKGRWIKELGDGVMASFNTVSDAVNAAIAIQKGCNEAKEFQLRIGIHLGEVVFENEDVFGDGVNIASRIQAIASPGSIFISESVYENISNKKDFQAKFVKEQILKNVREPVRIYKVITPDKSEILTIKEQSPDHLPPKSIAVLPFVNMSNDPEQEYFSEGMAEEILNSLTHLKDLKVSGRTSSFQFKGKKIGLPELGHKLGVSKVLEGSVRKQGNRLRISVQLINVEDGFHLWSEKYDRDLDDIFAIQDEIALAVTEKLKVTLLEYDREQITKTHTQNTEAYQFYLRGRYFWNKRSQEGLETSMKYFHEAIDIDPNYALAWTGLADSYNLLREYGKASRNEGYSKAKAAAKKALEIDSQLGEAHISLASLLMNDEWDWLNALNEFKLGLEMNPNYATGHHWYAEWFMFQGSFKQALEEISKAAQLDPVSQAILTDRSLILYYSRQYDKAIEHTMPALQLDANFSSSHRILSLCYQAKGMFDLAIAENSLWGQLTGNHFKTTVALAQIYAVCGRKEEAKKIVESLSEQEIAAGNDYRALALVYASLNENDRVFNFLEKSYEAREYSLCCTKIDPKWDGIRDDPRFIELVGRMKFPALVG